MVTVEDKGFSTNRMQVYIYSDLYAVFFDGDPWDGYSYLHPVFSTRSNVQSSVVTWQDVKTRATVCTSGGRGYLTFPVDMFLTSGSLYNLGQLFAYFDFVYGSVSTRTILLMNVKAGK